MPPVHSADEPCIAEELLDRLIPALVRAGNLAPETLLELAEQIDRETATASVEREAELDRMASALRTWVISAAGPTQAEWEAERRRRRFSVVEIPGN